MSIFSRCMAIVAKDQNGAEVFFLPFRSHLMEPNFRVFGPFTMKAADRVYDGVTIKPQFLSQEETTELLNLERWGYIQIVEEGNGARAERWAPPHFPKSSALRLPLSKESFRRIYEPYFYESEMRVAEEFMQREKPLPVPLFTEQQKCIAVLHCLWHYLVNRFAVISAQLRSKF